MGHDTHHNTEKKPHFGPAVIMGLSFWLFAFFFLSLCNGKKEHGAHEAAAEHGAKTEMVEEVKGEPKAESSVIVGDSVEISMFDSLGKEIFVKIPSMIVKVSISKFKEANKIGDLVDFKLKGKEGFVSIVTANIKGKVMSVNNEGETFNDEAKKIISGVEVGTKLALEIKSNANIGDSQVFSITVVE